MTIQLILKPDGELCVKNATDLRDDAIGEFNGSQLFLYLKNGKIYYFGKFKMGWETFGDPNYDYETEKSPKRFRTTSLYYEMMNNKKFMPVDVKSWTIPFDLKERILFAYNDVEKYKLIKNLYDDFRDNYIFNFNKYKNLKFKDIYETLYGFLEYAGTTKMRIYHYFIGDVCCMTVRNSSQYIHYIVTPDFSHYHSVNSIRVMKQEHLKNLVKCSCSMVDCHYNLSAFE